MQNGKGVKLSKFQGLFGKSVVSNLLQSIRLLNLVVLCLCSFPQYITESPDGMTSIKSPSREPYIPCHVNRCCIFIPVTDLRAAQSRPMPSRTTYLP